MNQSKKIYRKALQRIVQAALYAGMLFFANGYVAQEPSLPTLHVHKQVINGEAKFVRAMDEEQVLPIDFVLPLRNEADLDQLLGDLYNPQSAKFGQYLEVNQFTDRFGPTEQDYKAAMDFAKSHNMTITNTYPNRLALGIKGKVKDIQAAFNVHMNVYQHPTENREFFSADTEPAIFDGRVHLYHIAGLENMTPPRPLYKRGPDFHTFPVSEVEAHFKTTSNAAATGSGPNGNFISSDIRAAYYGGTLTGTGRSVGLMEFAGINVQDVKNYFSTLHQPLNVPIQVISVDGSSTACNPKNCDDTEQATDVEQAIGMAPGLQKVVVYISTSSDVKIFNAMASTILTRGLSNSWGWDAADPGTDGPIFKEFAAQGQTLFVASGDSGSYTANSPSYPADGLLVTAVGATSLTTNGPGGAYVSEKAWVHSGGGLSPHRYAIPSYQSAAGVITAGSGGSTTIRNVPDVAGEGDTVNYVCANGECGTGLGGTSLAAPQWAGFVCLVNEQRAAAGAHKVGFANPGVYSVSLGANYAADLHDITSGNNGGFKAGKGYDLVTGWGSPSAALVNDLFR